MSRRVGKVQRVILAAFTAILASCGGGSSSSSNTSDTPITSTPTTYVASTAQENTEQGSGLTSRVTEQTVAAPLVVEVGGTVSFDRVPFGGRSYSGLDYEQTYIAPLRGVTVQALNRQGGVVASTQTNEFGAYSFSVAQNSEIQIRVVAELVGAGSAAWDIQVKDNTQGNAVYVLDGALASVGSNVNQTRDLHAQSGWVGNSYAEARSAAPFAILDSIYDAIIKVVSADSAIVLPPLSVYWSENNIAISGRLSDGNIGTSFYTSAGPSIYLLGASNNDSDEYDRGVIQHEFGHYLEHQIGRTESIGGSHNQNSKLDMRVAFGEAWGNAFSAMVSGDPLYRDSLGAHQALGFSVDVESRSRGSQGWYNEATVQAILYDLYDANSDDSDNIELGFKAIYEVFISEAYLDFEGFASIYSFAQQLKVQNPNYADEISALIESYDIYGTGWWGEGETNDAGSSVILPLYHILSAGESTQVCSDNDYQEYNGVDTRRFIRLDISARGSYSIYVTRSSGDVTSTNPQLRLFTRGAEIAAATSSQRNYESLTRTLNSGEYILEVYEQANVDNENATGGLACFEVALN